MPIDASVVVRITAAFAAAFTKARFFWGTFYFKYICINEQ
jgi:hypothetical protein